MGVLWREGERRGIWLLPEEGTGEYPSASRERVAFWVKKEGHGMAQASFSLRPLSVKGGSTKSFPGLMILSDAAERAHTREHTRQ
mmetsp:Transcript_13037/g.24335  ORF Transcript_13037/g.24335 Transcript_13037/m.24335 type:complete len:85 (-) Transcript_13037:491-745(-)